jgi:hypothetical protein
MVTLFYRSPADAAPQGPGAIQSPQEAEKPRLVIPDAQWEPLLFSSIDEVVDQTKLPKLRTILRGNDDLEVRIWALGGENRMIHGFILRRLDSQWSLIRIKSMGEHQQIQKYEESTSPPKSGWDAAWKKLVSAGVLTLPDGSEVQCNATMFDGVGYVVEINMDRTYRTYMYENPALAKCGEAQQMKQIAKIIDEEFGW